MHFMTATVTKTRTFSLFAFARINDTFSFDFRELIHYTVYFRHVMRSTYGKITYAYRTCVNRKNNVRRTLMCNTYHLACTTLHNHRRSTRTVPVT